jgi:hypothetical protein
MIFLDFVFLHTFLSIICRLAQYLTLMEGICITLKVNKIELIIYQNRVILNLNLKFIAEKKITLY